jgi:hypothetical protein
VAGQVLGDIALVMVLCLCEMSSRNASADRASTTGAAARRDPGARDSRVAVGQYLRRWGGILGGHDGVTARAHLIETRARTVRL